MTRELIPKNTLYCPCSVQILLLVTAFSHPPTLAYHIILTYTVLMYCFHSLNCIFNDVLSTVMS